MDLARHKVEVIPDSAFLVPEFVSEEEERAVLANIYRTSKVRWTQLKNRRLLNMGGVPHARGMIPEQMPAWLQSVVDRVNAVGHLPAQSLANHVLVNEYDAGQGIMPHFDGDLFFPVISTVSLGSHTVLNFYDDVEDGSATHLPFEDRLRFSLLVPPRSLLVLKDDLYTTYLHGIDEVCSDTLDNRVVNARGLAEPGQELARATRISLTIRNVPKTAKMKLRL